MHTDLSGLMAVCSGCAPSDSFNL